MALSALAQLEDERVVPALLEAARDPLEPLRVAAINPLSTRSDADAAAALVQLLFDAKESVLALHEALEGADDDQAALLASCIARSRPVGPGLVVQDALVGERRALSTCACSSEAPRCTPK